MNLLSNVKNYNEQGGHRTVIGGELEILPTGKLIIDGSEIKSLAHQNDSAALDLADLVLDFNALLLKLKNAGLMKDE